MSSSSPTSDPIAELLASAAAHAKSGAYEEARVQLDSLVGIEPRHELALGMLAAVYAELEQLGQSANYFQRVLEINTENSLARFQFGLVLLKAQRPNEALTVWERGNYTDHEYLVDYHRGLALQQLDCPREALATFQRAREFMPSQHVLYPQLMAHLSSLTE